MSGLLRRCPGTEVKATLRAVADARLEFGPGPTDNGYHHSCSCFHS
jgi:hypothetical protein